MRNLFLVGAKLLGMLGLYWTILIIPQIGFLLGANAQMNEDNFSGAWMFSGLLLYFLLSLAFGLILIFRTEKVADLLRIKKAEVQEIKPKTDDMLRIGIILVGIFLLASAIPKLTKTIFVMAQSLSGLMSIYSSDLISSILQICLGEWLSFSSSKVIHIISKRESKLNITSRSSRPEELMQLSNIFIFASVFRIALFLGRPLPAV